MSLAENELENRPFTGADDYAKRRQARRAAAAESAPAAPEGEGEPPVTENIPDEPAGDDPAIVVDGEGSGDEPAERPPLTPPASMAPADQELFEQLPDELKDHVLKVTKGTRKTLQESGEQLANRTKELEAKLAEADQLRDHAQTILQEQFGSLPFSDDDLRRIAEEEGSDEWIKAKQANEDASAKIQKSWTDLQERSKKRHEETAAKVLADLPTLIEEWKDQEVLAKESKAMDAHFDPVLSAQEKQAIIGSARLVEMARKAWKYDLAVAGKEKGKPVVANAKPTAPGGRRPVTSVDSKVEAAEKAWKENPSEKNFVALRRAKREAAEAQTKRRA